jgi:hypothetical protein
VKGSRDVKPTVPEVAPIVRSLYARHGGGCCWHIVLDDGNVDDAHVSWVVNEWMPQTACKGVECRQLAELIPKMSRTQRLRLGEVANDR